MFPPKGPHNPQLTEASLFNMFVGFSVNGSYMFPHKGPISGSKTLGFISKGSHTQDNQSQGNALPRLFTAPHAHSNMDTSTHTKEVREETNVFTKTLWEPSCQNREGLWKVSHQQGGRSQLFKQNFIKGMLLQGRLPQGPERESMAGDVSTKSVSKVAAFWKVKVGWIL